MNKITALVEWSWLFSIYAGYAYGKHLNGEKVDLISYPNSDPFFYFADSIEYTTQAQDFKQGTSKIYDTNFDPKSIYPEWTPPPYQEYYSQFFKPEDDRDVIVISNKFNKEWAGGPYNYLSLEFLEEFFEKFSSKFKIYYIRFNGQSRDTDQEYYDDVTPPPFDDYPIVKKYNIETVYDVMNKYNIGFNTAQLYIHSAAKHTVTVAGGNSILSAYFGKEMIQFNCPNCQSANRQVWGSDTWLNKFNNVKIIGYKNHNHIMQTAEDRWLYAD